MTSEGPHFKWSGSGWCLIVPLVLGLVSLLLQALSLALRIWRPSLSAHLPAAIASVVLRLLLLATATGISAGFGMIFIGSVPHSAVASLVASLCYTVAWGLVMAEVSTLCLCCGCPDVDEEPDQPDQPIDGPAQTAV